MKSKKIALKTGTLIVPKDFIVIEETRTDNSDYAGIIAEKHGKLPHYVVFSDKPINSMSATEEDAIYEECSKIHPEIGEYLDREVELSFDEDGKIENAQEWLASVRLGLFGVPDKKHGDEFFCGTAIYREA